MKINWFVLPFLLIGCSQLEADVAQGPVILQCDGTTGTTSEPVITARKIFRIDGKAKTFEQWQEEEAAFAPWGDGDLVVSAKTIRFIGTNAVGVRTVSIDRSTSEITDQFEAMPSFVGVFSGTCKAVKTPAPLKTKF